MKDLVIFHGNCDDGFGAAFSHWFWDGRSFVDFIVNIDETTGKVVKQFETNTAIYYEGFYGEKFPEHLLSKVDSVYILDFSYPPEVLKDICTKVERVVVLDHHKGAIDKLEDLAMESPENLTLILNMKYSGAALSWSYFSKYSMDILPIFIGHISDNDLWKFEMPHTKEFIEAIRSYPRTFHTWYDIYMRTQQTEGEYEKIVAEGESILKYKANIMEGIIEFSAYPVVVSGVEGLACNAPKIFSSDIGNELAKRTRTFGMTWVLDKEGKAICSLRSIGDFDVNELAKTLGGGGHKNSAGFTLDSHEDMLELFIPYTR